MRLDFNIVLIDDDKDDSQRNRGVNRLKQRVENHIKKKGFKPIIRFEKSSHPILTLNNSDKKRIDLYLSDNNLSNNSQENNENEEDGGIELYLSLKALFICDFILYSRSDKSTIIRKLINDLNEKQNPNLFSRFSFVERNSTNEVWINDILHVIDHIISKREELNNLRGIFAQVMSRVHHYLRDRYSYPSDLDLDGVLKRVDRERKIVRTDFDELMELKSIRNGLLHNDEKICQATERRYIEYKSFTRSISGELVERVSQIYEDQDYDQFRTRLFRVFDKYK